jgi:phospholipase C
MADTPPDDQNQDRSNTSRRTVIKGVAGVAGSAAISAAVPRAFAQVATTGLPDPKTSGIDHIVVLMMENRSFDHMLGWVPGADGVQAGRSFVDTAGNTAQSFHLASTQSCSSSDPNHGYGPGRTQMNGGAMDGFLKTQPVGDHFPIGYFSASDVPFFSFAQKHWTLCDQYHCSILGPTWPNRFYMHSGQTDRLTTGGPAAKALQVPGDTTGGLESGIFPTIWDLAAQAGLTAKYYPQNPAAAFTALWGTKFTSITRPFAEFMSDATNGTLPSISYIDPNFVGEGTGTGNDDHPLNDIRNGQLLMNQVYTALVNSPNWPNTLFIINYDEWGGFADHVVPPLAPVSSTEYNIAGNGTSGGVDSATPNMAFLGFRTPLVMIGPRARRGAVVHTLYDAVSILNMISWRFGLPTPWARAQSSINMATALNFSQPANTTVPPGVTIANMQYGMNCSMPTTGMLPEGVHESFRDHYAEVEILKNLAKKHGFV